MVSKALILGGLLAGPRRRRRRLGGHRPKTVHGLRLLLRQHAAHGGQGIAFDVRRRQVPRRPSAPAAGPPRLTCEARACSAIAYGFARFARLEVTLSNGRT